MRSCQRPYGDTRHARASAAAPRAVAADGFRHRLPVADRIPTMKAVTKNRLERF